MQSTQQPIFFQTIPNTAGPTDARIVIGNNIPSELLTWANANNITLSAVVLFYFGTLGTAYTWQAVGTVGVTPCYFTGTWDNQNNVYLLNRVFLTGLNQIWETIGSGTLNSSRLNYSFSNVKVDVLGTSADGVELLGDDVGGFGGRIDSIVLGQGEPWHLASYTFPWTARASPAVPLKYKFVPSPAKSVWLLGEAVPNGATNGSLITTLPANYRPVSTIAISAGNGGNTGGSCTVQIDSTGGVRAFANGGFGVAIQINSLISLDA